MTDALDGLPRRAQLCWAAPMLAVLREERFSSEEWIFERKLDGGRCLVPGRGGELRLLSGMRKQLNETYPGLVEALLARARDDFKCVNEQEFVIGGYTDRGGKRVGVGALLVGYYEALGRLRSAGKVGSGYRDAVLRDLSARRARFEQAEPRFARDRFPRSGVRWVRPELVAQIGFAEVTGDGKLRHPRFFGLRRDKRPRDVVLERPGG